MVQRLGRSTSSNFLHAAIDGDGFRAKIVVQPRFFDRCPAAYVNARLPMHVYAKSWAYFLIPNELESCWQKLP